MAQKYNKSGDEGEELESVRKRIAQLETFNCRLSVSRELDKWATGPDKKHTTHQMQEMFLTASQQMLGGLKTTALKTLSGQGSNGEHGGLGTVAGFTKFRQACERKWTTGPVGAKLQRIADEGELCGDMRDCLRDIVEKTKHKDACGGSEAGADKDDECGLLERLMKDAERRVKGDEAEKEIAEEKSEEANKAAAALAKIRKAEAGVGGAGSEEM